jgi:hypothetical protein
MPFRPLGGGGGGPGSPGPPGQGVPVGGNLYDVLAKRSGANYDTNWVHAPAYAFFTATTRIQLVGNELQDASVDCSIPASALPPVKMDWFCEGNGYGTLFTTNENMQGLPPLPTGGGMFVDTLLDGAWVQLASISWSSSVPPPGPPGLARLTPYTGISTRLLHFDPAVDTAGIQMRTRFTTWWPGQGVNGPIGFTFGIQGMIVRTTP